MKLIVMGSSSRGNGYLLQSEKTGEVLAIEAGIRLSKAREILKGNISSIVGCCVSHEHGDHAKYIRQYLDAYIPVVCPEGTAAHLKLVASNLHEGKEGDVLHFGGFTVRPFLVKHDVGVPCFAYIIQHPECGNVLFATDCAYLPKRIRGLNNLLIEANYRKDIIEDNYRYGRIAKKHYDHTILGHMSFETCLETLRVNDLSKVCNIVLIHLSDANSNEHEFVRDARLATGKYVVAAGPEMVMNLNKTPY
jgi:phosphoribosyl 1,2-cyclic phosphodiesterase